MVRLIPPDLASVIRLLNSLITQLFCLLNRQLILGKTDTPRISRASFTYSIYLRTQFIHLLNSFAYSTHNPYLVRLVRLPVKETL